MKNKVVITTKELEKSIANICDTYRARMTGKAIAKISELAEKHPIYQEFLQYIPGMNSYFSGIILGMISFDKIECLSQMYSYVGLKGGTRNYNRYIYGILLRTANNFIEVDSPYTIYYYNNILKEVRESDKIKSAALIKHNAKLYMLKQFLKDLTYVYRKYFNIDQLEDNTLKQDESLVFSKSFNKVDTEDFLYINEIPTGSKKSNWIKTINGKYSINVSKLKSQVEYYKIA